MSVTQINGQRAKQVIQVLGITWNLKKDATDPSVIFPFEKMVWINAGCDKVENTNFYCCWIMGVIPPTPGSLERPVSVFTLGFNSVPITMSPAALTRQDMQRMHYYTSDYGDFTKKFINSFLDLRLPEEAANRPSMMAFPEPANEPAQVVDVTNHQSQQTPRIVDLNN